MSNNYLEKVRQAYRNRFCCMTESSDWTLGPSGEALLNGSEVCEDGEPMYWRRLRMFAQEHSIDIDDVSDFNTTANKYVRYTTMAINGDSPDSWDNGDKNENAKRSQAIADRHAARLDVIAKSWGFHHVDFGVGLWPTLQRSEDETIGTVHFPYHEH